MILLFDAIDTTITLAHAFLWWLLGLAAAGTVLVLAVWCTLAAVWRAIRRRLTRPSWAHSRRAARQYARNLRKAA
ncbi:hypothetical protein ACFYQQ_01055 [Streptomyces sp. NPDC005496]|uniref:hypothetical protein n=1 Tax=unclassified Streptomyces TaxID=2593676 RepID=UPI0033A0A875